MRYIMPLAKFNENYSPIFFRKVKNMSLAAALQTAYKDGFIETDEIDDFIEGDTPYQVFKKTEKGSTYFIAIYKS